MENKEKIQPRIQHLEGTIPVIIHKKVYDQIKVLTSVINNVEWSGVLFYSVKGDMDNVATFEITLEYIYLMDKGTHGSTEYEPDEELTTFMMDNPESLQWKMGHVHSHANMNVFFSSTDTEEIQENSEFHNNYLSVIVNNRLEFIGEVAFRGTINNKRPYTCKLSSGKNYNLNLVSPEQVVFIYKCEIIHPESIEVSDAFNKRIEEIIEKKKYRPVAKGREIQSFNEESNKRIEELDAKYGYGHERIDVWDDTVDFEEIQWRDEYAVYYILQGQIGYEHFDFHSACEFIHDRIKEDKILDYVSELIEFSTETYQRYFIDDVNPEIPIEEVYKVVMETIKEHLNDYKFLGQLYSGLEAFMIALNEKED